MKFKAVETEGIPPSVSRAIQTPRFFRELLTEVVGGCLKVENVLERPAEFYAQLNDVTAEITPGCWGVEVRLTGASWNADRDFKAAVNLTHQIYRDTIAANLSVGQRVQLMCAIMVSGGPNDLYESDAEWVEGELTV
jgi:hypothetical protein